jgi:hypothetical protein
MDGESIRYDLLLRMTAFGFLVEFFRRTDWKPAHTSSRIRQENRKYRHTICTVGFVFGLLQWELCIPPIPRQPIKTNLQILVRNFSLVQRAPQSGVEVLPIAALSVREHPVNTAIYTNVSFLATLFTHASFVMARTPDFVGWSAPDLRLPLLENTLTDTRLLTLLPGRVGDHICCTLTATSLSSPHMTYNALSYTWGEAHGQRIIECNGCRAHVRRNLHSALSRLRKTDDAVVLWTDALCINQSNTDEALAEREVQVRMMDRIYSQADLVYVDLGEDVPEMAKVLQLAQKFDIIPHDVRLDRVKALEAFKSYNLPDIDDPAWPDVIRFMTRPWFARVWIMQEFILAKNVQVMVGIRRPQYEFLQWLVLASIYYRSRINDIPSDYAARADFYRSYMRLRSQLDPGVGNLVGLLEARKFHQENSPDYRGFSTLLARSRNFDATDKRERAYALLGLADDLDPRQFPVRYKNETVDQTAQRVSKYLLIDSDGRLIDGRAAIYRTVGLLGSAPSWAYDLAGLVQPDGLLAQIDDSGISRVFQAGVGDAYLEASISGPVLTVTGFVLGSIAELTDAFDPPAPGQGNSGIYGMNWILGTARWSTRIQRSSRTKLVSTALWTTSFAGLFLEGWGQVVRFDEHPELDQQLSDFVEAVQELEGKVGDHGKLEDLGQSCNHLIPKLLPIIRLIGAAARGRRLAYTSDNLLALVCRDAQVGDALSIFQGTPLPFVLRKAQGGQRLVGTCYVHNMMDGEVFLDPKWTPRKIEIC